MRSFLTVHDRTGPELTALVAHAADLAQAVRDRRPPPVLDGLRIGVWWDGGGFRNRVAFELGARLLGATVVEIPGPVGPALGEPEAGGEPAEDIAAYLANWLDLVVVRTPSFDRLAALASGGLPVINARTTHNHPCETLGDLAFLAHRGWSPDQPLAVTYVGPATNIGRSWVEATAVLPLAVTQVCPPGYEIEEAWWQALAPNPAGTFGAVDALDEQALAADVLVTDVRPAGLPPEVDAAFDELRITTEVLDRCSPELAFVPCPPVSRGSEVDAAALDDPRCVVVEAKAWLLHAQNALLASMAAEVA